MLLDPCEVSSAPRDVGFSLLSLFVGTIEVLTRVTLGFSQCLVAGLLCQRQGRQLIRRSDRENFIIEAREMEPSEEE